MKFLLFWEALTKNYQYFWKHSLMGSQNSSNPSYNPYYLDRTALANFIENAIDFEYSQEDLILVMNIRSIKILNRRLHKKPNKKFIQYYCHCVAAITILEKKYRLLNNPQTGEPWINLVTHLQQSLDIFSQFNKLRLAC